MWYHMHGVHVRAAMIVHCYFPVHADKCTMADPSAPPPSYEEVQQHDNSYRQTTAPQPQQLKASQTPTTGFQQRQEGYPNEAKPPFPQSQEPTAPAAPYPPSQAFHQQPQQWMAGYPPQAFPPPVTVSVPPIYQSDTSTCFMLSINFHKFNFP